MSINAPRWDLSNIFSSLESTEFENARSSLIEQINAIDNLLCTRDAAHEQAASITEVANLVGELISKFNQAQELAETLAAYIYAFVSTDSQDSLANRRFSELEQITVKLSNCSTRFKAWIGSMRTDLDEIIASDNLASEHAFFLHETALQSEFLMSEAEESLAEELSLSGANSWEKLQGTITSQILVDFELDGEKKQLSFPEIINLHSHSDEDVRRRAYEAEIQALDTVREPLAACLNGIKGAVVVLNRRRGRSDAVHSALERARIDRPVLEAMLASMESALPTFRAYFKSKANRLGKEKLAWWDIYAPINSQKQTFTFQQAQDLIEENFEEFSPDLSEFAKKAFQRKWIDAEQRPGKRGGAFCMDIPTVKESRILSNFDGSLDQVSTIAHELGHAYHNHCAFKAGKTALQRRTPMTLAETASIMCETIVLQAALRTADTPENKLSALETLLIGQSQVIVDILSRYQFEKDVFERREKSDLSVQEICESMEKAQQATYGESLDWGYLNRYMWAWKPHYYSESLSFYNFPYAFGLLFGLGLYAIYQQDADAFVPKYQRLLASTGETSPEELAAGFGLNIRERDFWDASLKVIGENIRLYLRL